MYSQKTRYWRHPLMLPLLGALLGQPALAADTAPLFPHASSLPLPAAAAAPASRPIVDDEDCGDAGVALPLAASPLAASPADPIRLAVSPHMSSPGVRPPPAATPFAASPAEPALTLRKEGPLVWQAAAATPVEPAPAATAAVSTWDIAVTDVSLNAVLARWAAIAGWQLVWELPVDYALESRLTLTGTFEDAVEAVARSMASGEEPMQAIFYRKNKVVRIVAKGAR
jgi:hypothetical protein